MIDRFTIQLQRYFSEHAYEILGAIAFLFVAVLFAFFVGRAIRFLMSDTFEADPTITKLAVRLLRFTIIVLAVVVVLDEFGINVTSVIAAFSVVGLAMAFGLRTTMTNFFTGAMISALKPYEVGDEIDAERVTGVVESTNLFCTVVVTDDGTYVSIPNGPMWAKSIKNRSRVRPMRVILDIVVHREASYREIRATIDQVFKTDDTRHTEFAARIRIVDVTESGMVLQASAWYLPDAFWAARDALPRKLIDKLAVDGNKNVTVVPRTLARPKKSTKESAAEPANDDIL